MSFLERDVSYEDATDKGVSSSSEEAAENYGKKIVGTKVLENETRAPNRDAVRAKKIEPAELFTKELVDMSYLGAPRETLKPLLNTLAEVNVSYKVTTTAVFCPC